MILSVWAIPLAPVDAAGFALVASATTSVVFAFSARAVTVSPTPTPVVLIGDGFVLIGRARRHKARARKERLQRLREDQATTKAIISEDAEGRPSLRDYLHDRSDHDGSDSDTAKDCLVETASLACPGLGAALRGRDEYTKDS